MARYCSPLGICVKPNLKAVETEVQIGISFADFWQAYPKRVARKDALKAWSRINPSDYPKILRAVSLAKQTEQWQKDEGQYIPHAASYLRGERWEDELVVDIPKPINPSTDTTCCNIIAGVRCAKPSVGSNAARTKFYCRECGPL